MGLKDFKEKWETWSQGKKIGSVILGCCILVIVFSIIGGMLTPDANNGSYDDETPFEIYANDIPINSSSISIVSKDTKSSSYAYFYTDGSYAEPAYTTHYSNEIDIKLDMNELKISNSSSVTEYPGFLGIGGDVYNQTYLKDDIQKLLKSNNTYFELKCYDENNTQITTIDDFNVTYKNGLLSLTNSYSYTSDYHTGTWGDSDYDDIDHAYVIISGTVPGKDGGRDIDFELHSKKIKV